MALKDYKTKRNFLTSKEPLPKLHKRKGKELQFVIQKHAARRLHYDFRLELKGVLKSWAVPKGPSLNPKDKRLAIMVEDHPYGYKDFEGTIEKGYGAGTVEIWDKGTYQVYENERDASEKLMIEGLKKGEVHFTLNGEKLKGDFTLIRLNKSEKNEWLLIKKNDRYATSEKVISEENSSRRKKTVINEDILKKAPKKRMPHPIEPMLATLIDAPFDDEKWLFEIKWDGYRAIAEVKAKNVELYSRNYLPFNLRFPVIVEYLKQLNVQAIFDGEIVVLNKKGMTRFQSLQNLQSELPKGEQLYYYVFDLLYLNGHDLRSLSLIERKALLKQLLEAQPSSPIRYNDHIEKNGIEFFKLCSKKDLEGIIGKLKESTYTTGKRSKNWVKIKKNSRQEAIICGYTEPKGGRKNIGALIPGYIRIKPSIT